MDHPVQCTYTASCVIPRQIDREFVFLTPYPFRIFRNFVSGVVLVRNVLSIVLCITCQMLPSWESLFGSPSKLSSTHELRLLQTVWCTRPAWVVLTGEGSVERWHHRQPISPYSCILAYTCHGWITSVCTRDIVIFNGLDAVLEVFRHNPSDGSITPLAARPSVTPNVRPYRSSRTEHDYHRHDPSSVG